MRTTYVLLMFLGLASFAAGQVNYVLNPSFEDHTQCPNGLDQLKKANYWSSIDTANPASYAAAEYMNACAGNSPWGVPSNGGFYHHDARTGKALTLSILFADESQPTNITRDYSQGRLRTNLTAGVSYCVTFYVCLAPAAYAVNNFGAYLDAGTIDTLTQGYGLAQTQYTPQVNETNVITDSVHWTKIEGSFIANGAERFITIGNFFDKTNTTCQLAMDPNDTADLWQVGGWAYYLVDDVSVVASDLPAFAGNDTTISQGDSALIGRDEIIPDIKWMIGNNVIDTVHAGLWVKPNETTTYTLEQSICGIVKYDTVTITVIPDTSINDTTIVDPIDTDTVTNPVDIPYVDYSKGFRMYPNPSRGDFTISLQLKSKGTLEMTIFDVCGRKVNERRISFEKNIKEVHIDTAPGIYIVELKDKLGGRYLQRLIID